MPKRTTFHATNAIGGPTQDWTHVRTTSGPSTGPRTQPIAGYANACLWGWRPCTNTSWPSTERRCTSAAIAAKITCRKSHARPTKISALRRTGSLNLRGRQAFRSRRSGLWCRFGGQRGRGRGRWNDLRGHRGLIRVRSDLWGWSGGRSKPRRPDTNPVRQRGWQGGRGGYQMVSLSY